MQIIIYYGMKNKEFKQQVTNIKGFQLFFLTL